MFNSANLHETVINSLKWKFDGPFREFVLSHPNRKWAIVSDYVIGDLSARNDALAFTVLPVKEKTLSKTGIQSFASRDLKKIKIVSQDTLSYLRNGDHFTFCFAVEKKRHQRTSTESIQNILSITKAQSEKWRPGEARNQFLNKLSLVQQELKAKSFRQDIFEDGCLVSNLAALLAFNTIKFSRSDGLIWIPDRDTMTESFKGFFFDAYNVSFVGLCQNNGVPSDHVLVGIGIHDPKSAPGSKPWYDDLVRLPDYHVGALAKWDFLLNTVEKQKHLQIVSEVFAGNERVCLAYLQFPFYGPTCSLIQIEYVEGPEYNSQQRRKFEHLLNMTFLELCNPLDKALSSTISALMASTVLTNIGNHAAKLAFQPPRSFVLPETQNF